MRGRRLRAGLPSTVVAVGIGVLIATSTRATTAMAERRASVWDRATEPADAALRRSRADGELAAGNDFAMMAMSPDISAAERRRLFGRAEASYRAALVADPNHSEATYRLAQLLDFFVVDCVMPIGRRCRAGVLDVTTGREVVELWQRFSGN